MHFLAKGNTYEDTAAMFGTAVHGIMHEAVRALEKHFFHQAINILCGTRVESIDCGL